MRSTEKALICQPERSIIYATSHTILARSTEICEPTKSVKKPTQKSAKNIRIHTGNDLKRNDKNKRIIVILKPLTATM